MDRRRVCVKMRPARMGKSSCVCVCVCDYCTLFDNTICLCVWLWVLCTLSSELLGSGALRWRGNVAFSSHLLCTQLQLQKSNEHSPFSSWRTFDFPRFVFTERSLLLLQPLLFDQSIAEGASTHRISQFKTQTNARAPPQKPFYAFRADVVRDEFKCKKIHFDPAPERASHSSFAPHAHIIINIQTCARAARSVFGVRFIRE